MNFTIQRTQRVASSGLRPGQSIPECHPHSKHGIPVFCISTLITLRAYPLYASSPAGKREAMDKRTVLYTG